MSRTIYSAYFGVVYHRRSRWVWGASIKWKKVDYAVPDKQQPKILIEAKSLGTSLDDNRGQLSEYLDLSDVNYRILTNGFGFEFMKRKRKSRNEIINKFSLREHHPKVIEKNKSVDTKGRWSTVGSSPTASDKYLHTQCWSLIPTGYSSVFPRIPYGNTPEPIIP